MFKDIESAILVHIDFQRGENQEDLAEFHELALAAGVSPAGVIGGSRQSPDAKYFVGTGKAEEIHQCAQAHNVDLILFNHELSPAQGRNLQQLCQCKVVDRTDLILDIFAQRARTFEGKLQVELAQLEHLATRLVRGWTHLERQKGGIGLRGPGETQLETDRRLLRERIKTIRKRLEKVRRQREQGRRARRRAAIPTVALVGYTNAGKSTLFNTLSNAEVFAADQLFATLDPTLRRIKLTDVGDVILADTVGFIRHLPHDLVESFKATLEEVREAELLLHVVDAHSTTSRANIEQVHAVLAEIGAQRVPQLQVFNKIDLLEHHKTRIERNNAGQPSRVWLSATEGRGLELLKLAMQELLMQEMVIRDVCLPVASAALRAKLYKQGAVLAEAIDEHGHYILTVRLPYNEFERTLQGK